MAFWYRRTSSVLSRIWEAKLHHWHDTRIKLSVPTHVIESTAMTFSLRLGTKAIKTDLLFKFLSCRLSFSGPAFPLLPTLIYVAAFEPGSATRYRVCWFKTIIHSCVRFHVNKNRLKKEEEKDHETERNGRRRHGSNYRSTLSAKVSNHHALAPTVNFSTK